MAGIAMLLPDEELIPHTQRMIDKESSHIMYIKQTSTETVVEEARNAISQGANIVIARGYQATHLKKHTNIPIVALRFTAQELGLLIIRAKKILNKPNPRIGIFYWEGMLCNTEHFNELFDVKLHWYQLNDDFPWSYIVEEALEKDEIEFVIGGQKCVFCANANGIPALLLSTTDESLHFAIQQAEDLYNILETEQRNYAQFSSLLDSSFNGIIKINEQGIILLINHVMAQILQIRQTDVIGIPIQNFLPELDYEILQKVLSGERKNYSTFINHSNQALVIIVESIVVNNQVMGAIISCNPIKQIGFKSGTNVHKQFLHGNVAHGSLNEMAKNYPDLKHAINTAKIYAQSSSPILIYGSHDESVDALCQGIHNYSLRKGGPYITINLNHMEEQQQFSTIFGQKNEDGTFQSGVLSNANFGTLVIYHIEKLNKIAQYHLLAAISKKHISSDIGEKLFSNIDVRIIAHTSEDLRFLQKHHPMQLDLYCLLQTFCITIPPLRERKQDLAILLDTSFNDYLSLYSYYHTLSNSARDAILNYTWEGNESQIRAFCECLVLTSGKRVITEEHVRFLLDELYAPPQSQIVIDSLQEEQPPEIREKKQILEMLHKYNGNKTLTAKALGISTTTLWRRLQKYNVTIK